jgi:MFS family permease
VFAVPFLSRLSTVLFHARTSNVRYDLQLVREIRLEHLFLLPAHRNELWFLMFIAMMNFAVQFASPFFTPYMLEQLGFDMGMLGIMTALSVLAKIVSYPYWGKAIDRFGNRAVLIATAAATPLVPLLWLFSADPFWIGIFQVFSGFVWSGFDLAAVNSSLSLVGRELRPSFMSKYNMFAGIFNAAGAVAGGLFLAGFGTLSILGFSGILLVFLISGLVRFATVVLFAPKLSAAGRGVENTSGQRAMILNLVAVYPTQGAVQQALGGWDFTRKIVERCTAHGRMAIRSGLDATGELLKGKQRKISHSVSKKRRL